MGRFVPDSKGSYSRCFGSFGEGGHSDGVWSGFKRVYVQRLVVAVVSCPFSPKQCSIGSKHTPATFLKFDDMGTCNF